MKRLIRRCRWLGVFALPMSLILMSCKSEAGREKIIRLSDYGTKDSVDFRRLEADVKANAYGKRHSSNRPAICKNGKHGCIVAVNIVAAGKSWDIQPLKGPGSQRAIGSIENTDSADTEEQYLLGPRTTNIVVVDDAPLNRDKTSRTVWGFQDLKTGEFVKKGYVITCHSDGYKTKTSDLDFFPEEQCVPPINEPAVMQSSIAGGPNVLGLLKRLFRRTGASTMSSVGSVWFECDPGCCSGTTSLQL